MGNVDALIINNLSKLLHNMRGAKDINKKKKKANELFTFVVENINDIKNSTKIMQIIMRKLVEFHDTMKFDEAQLYYKKLFKSTLQDFKIPYKTEYSTFKPRWLDNNENIISKSEFEDFTDFFNGYVERNNYTIDKNTFIVKNDEINKYYYLKVDDFKNPVIKYEIC